METKNELTGFVVYEPRKFRSNGIAFSVNNRTLRFTTEAVTKIGAPDYVNIFFDDTKKRMLVTAAKKDYKNVFQLRKPSNRLSVRSAIFCAALCVQVQRLAGIEDREKLVSFKGRVYSPTQLIFDLSKHQEEA